MDPVNDPDQQLWEKKADLAAGVLSFRKDAADMLDDLLCDLLKTGSPVGRVEFTPRRSSRPCVLVLAIGDEDVAALTKATDPILETDSDGDRD